MVGSGAILETVGSFDNLRYNETPKGKLATVSTDSPCFELHIRPSNVAEIHNLVVNKFEKTLRVTRFIDAEGGTMLSAILHEAYGKDGISVEGGDRVKKWFVFRTLAMLLILCI